jgi:uncharacterized protein YuzE
MKKLLLLITISLLASCTTTRYVSVPEYHTDTLYKARTDSIRWRVVTNVIDSLNVRDSVILRVNDKGEVTGKDTWHWRDRFRSEKDSTDYYKSRLDSLSHIKTDTISKPYPIEKTVTIYKLHWWQKDFMWVGIIAVVALCGFAVIKNRKLLVKVLRL